MVRTKKQQRLRLFAAFVLSVAMLGLLLRLGVWQLDRAQFKETLAGQALKNSAQSPSMAHEIMQQAGSESWYFRPVRVVGRFDTTRQYLLDNRTLDGRAGYHVLSVFMYGTHRLLVNRGWVPVGADRQELPNVQTDAQQQTLTGRLAPLPGSGLMLGDAGYQQMGWPRVVQSVELKTINAQLDLSLLPAVLLLDSANPACLSCRWAAVRGISADRHSGYALQWFSLAIALVLLLVAASFFGSRRHAD
jgi:surfeit locus 1 family protein